jgi:hypothetical protein
MFDPFFPLGLFMGPLALCLFHYLEANRPADHAFSSGWSILLAFVAIWGLSLGILLLLFLSISSIASLGSESFDWLVWTTRAVSVLIVGMAYRRASRISKRRMITEDTNSDSVTPPPAVPPLPPDRR